MIEPNDLKEWPEFVGQALAENTSWALQWVGQMAGQTIRIVANHADLLDCLTRPLAHLKRQALGGHKPALEIEIHSQGLAASPSPVYFHRSANGQDAFQWLPQSRSAWARRARRVVTRFAHPEHLSLYEMGRPFHAMLALWVQDFYTQMVHAGLVAQSHRGLLIGGGSGQGKSTLALACLRAGWHFLGDDLCFLDAQGNGHSLYSTTFLQPQARARWPELPDPPLDPRFPWEEKSLTYLYPEQAARLGDAVPILAVILPGPEGKHLSRISPMEALRRLAPSSLLTGPLSAGKAGLEQLAGLVQTRPCFHLPWSCDPVESLSELLESLN